MNNVADGISLTVKFCIVKFCCRTDVGKDRKDQAESQSPCYASYHLYFGFYFSGQRG